MKFVNIKADNSMKTVVMSLGGSIIVPDEIQIKFLKKFKNFILKFLKKNYKFVIVTGGGSVARNYIKAASDISKITDEDKDWLGIHATRLNAHLIRTIFKKEAYPVVLDNPLKQIDGKKCKLFIASGWRPGWSTDYDAVLLAERFKADKVINASNIDYVYPVKSRKAGISPKAKLFNRVNEKEIILDKTHPIKDTTWAKYRKIIDSEWRPGMKSPIDPIAAKLASKLKMTIIVARGTDLKNLENIVLDKKFKGTVIHS